MNRESDFWMPSQRGERRVCGTCIYRKPDPVIGWFCACNTSENYALETDFEDCCMEFEPKKGQKSSKR